MGNALASVTALRPAKPQLPAFLAAILDREPAPDVGWQVPADTWIERHEQALLEALAALRAALTPADEGLIREKLAVILHRMWRDGTGFIWSTKEAAA